MLTTPLCNARTLGHATDSPLRTQEVALECQIQATFTLREDTNDLRVLVTNVLLGSKIIFAHHLLGHTTNRLC